MSRSDYSVSDEHLNAFVDDELDAEEKGRVFDEINRDEELNRRLCELHKVRQMVQHGYRNPPPPPNRRPKRRGAFNRPVAGAAAMLLLAVGALIGWFAHGPATPPPMTASNIEQGFSSRMEPKQNVILHLDSTDPQKVRTAFEEMEMILAGYRRSGQRYHLEIITNESGVNLLREGASPYSAKVEQLMERFDNISFMACAKALKRLQDRGVRPELLPGTGIAPSALEQIIMRLDQGWMYIKV